MVVRVVELEGELVVHRLEGSSFETEIEGIAGGSKGEFRRIIRRRRQQRRKEWEIVRGKTAALMGQTSQMGRSGGEALAEEGGEAVLGGGSGGACGGGLCSEPGGSGDGEERGEIPDKAESPESQIKAGLYQAWCTACVYFGFPPGQVIPALFVPTANEPPIERVLDKTQSYFLPVLFDDDGTPCEPRWGRGGDGHALKVVDNRWPAQPERALSDEEVDAGILREVDLVLVPALGVDGDGVRLGQGGGWYDRALRVFEEGTPVVAVVFDEEFLPAGTLPMEPHDRLVDAVIMPSGFMPLPQVNS